MHPPPLSSQAPRTPLLLLASLCNHRQQAARTRASTAASAAPDAPSIGSLAPQPTLEGGDASEPSTATIGSILPTGVASEQTEAASVPVGVQPAGMSAWGQGFGADLQVRSLRGERVENECMECSRMENECSSCSECGARALVHGWRCNLGQCECMGDRPNTAASVVPISSWPPLPSLAPASYTLVH